MKVEVVEKMLKLDMSNSSTGIKRFEFKTWRYFFDMLNVNFLVLQTDRSFWCSIEILELVLLVVFASFSRVIHNQWSFNWYKVKQFLMHIILWTNNMIKNIDFASDLEMTSKCKLFFEAVSFWGTVMGKIKLQTLIKFDAELFIGRSGLVFDEKMNYCWNG